MCTYEQYGGFRTDLGRCGNNLRCNEATEFGRRLIAGDEPLKYVPSAVVYHPVPAESLPACNQSVIPHTFMGLDGRLGGCLLGIESKASEK